MLRDLTGINLGDILVADYDADVIAEIPALEAVQYQVNIQEDIYITVASWSNEYFVVELNTIMEDGEVELIDEERTDDMQDVFDFIAFWEDIYEESEE